MNALALSPVVLSLLLLGAHFYRAGNVVMVALTLVLLGLVGVRRPWAARVVQMALLLGALEWVATLASIVTRRAAAGEPYARTAAILAAVAVVAGGSALLFLTRRMKRRYGLAPEE